MFEVPFAVGDTAGPPNGEPPRGMAATSIRRAPGRQRGIRRRRWSWPAPGAGMSRRSAAPGGAAFDAMHRHNAHVGDRLARRIEELAGDHRAFLEMQSQLGGLSFAHLRGLSAPRLDQRREAGLLHVEAVAARRQPVEDEAAILVVEALAAASPSASSGRALARVMAARPRSECWRLRPSRAPRSARSLPPGRWGRPGSSTARGTDRPRTATPACIEHLRDFPH